LVNLVPGALPHALVMARLWRSASLRDDCLLRRNETLVPSVLRRGVGGVAELIDLILADECRRDPTSSAKGAAIILSLGQRPRVGTMQIASAESAIQIGGCAMNRAFSARRSRNFGSWGVAPGFW
jgi:hypothetical protein